MTRSGNIGDANQDEISVLYRARIQVLVRPRSAAQPFYSIACLGKEDFKGEIYP